jgi:hypothetical protein
LPCGASLAPAAAAAAAPFGSGLALRRLLRLLLRSCCCSAAFAPSLSRLLPLLRPFERSRLLLLLRWLRRSLCNQTQQQTQQYTVSPAVDTMQMLHVSSHWRVDILNMIPSGIIHW